MIPATLRDRLRSRFLQEVDGAIDAVVAGGEAALFSALLAQAAWSESGLYPGVVLSAGPHGVYAAQELLRQAPEGIPSLLPLYEEAQRIALSHQGAGRQRNLGDLSWLARFPTLDEVQLSGYALETLAGLAHPSLRRAVLLACRLPDDARGVEAASRLEGLVLGNRSTPLRTLSGFAGCTRLRELRVDLTAEAELKGLELLSELRELELSGGGFRDLDALPSGLETLRLMGCKRLESVSAVGRCDDLRVLALERCRKLESLRGVERCTRLVEVKLSVLARLVDIAGLSNLHALETLELSSCKRLKSLAGLPATPTLRALDVSGLPSLATLEGLPVLPAVRRLEVDGSCVHTLDGIDALRGLEHLSVRGVPVEDVSAAAKLESLRILDLRGCRRLKAIDVLARSDSLAVIALDRSGVGRTDVEMGLRGRCTWAKEPELKP